MFKSFNTKFAVMLIAGSIVSGAVLATPANAKHAKTEVSTTESAQKLALANDGVATQQASVASGDTAKATKAVKPSQSNYFDVEKYNFDLGGTSACTGI